jgi:hypothetical protein
MVKPSGENTDDLAAVRRSEGRPRDHMRAQIEANDCARRVVGNLKLGGVER